MFFFEKWHKPVLLTLTDLPLSILYTIALNRCLHLFMLLVHVYFVCHSLVNKVVYVVAMGNVLYARTGWETVREG